MRSALVCLGVVLLGATARAAEASRVQRATRTLDLSRAHADPSPSTLDFLFPARSDQVLTAAELQLTFANSRLEGVRGLEVLVNSDRVAILGPQELSETKEARTIAIPQQDIADHNQLSLRLLTGADRTCAHVPAASWDFLQAADLSTESGPLPLPDDLAALPLPFLDRSFDTEAVIPTVLTSKSQEQIHAAGLVAGWFGATAGLPMRFPVSLGELPDTSAIVLIDGAGAAATLGLPVPEGPSIRMMDHPRFRGSNAKLVIVGGRTPEELVVAAETLATGHAPLKGPLLRIDRPPEHLQSQPYAAPRWLPGRFVQFADFPTHDPLTHQGTTPGTIAVKFRIAPDTWVWPAEYVSLDLGYLVRQPSGAPPPRLDVDFNGAFLAQLPPVSGRATLRIRAEQLRGFNELRVHVAYPGIDSCALSARDDSSVSLTPGSGLHLEHLQHFANLPDVATFVHDGFPFTRREDLAETAVVLPNVPDSAEIGTLLSLLAHFASVTGVVGTSVTILTANELLSHPELDKDLLLVGLPGDHRVLDLWANRMPLALTPSGISVQMPSQDNPLLRGLGGHLGLTELKRARRLADGLRAFAAVTGWQSPLKPGRSVVAVTATSAASLPAIADLSGFADASDRAGDLLVAADGKRWMFRIGPSYGAGALDPGTGLRWTLATHWLALIPGILLAAFVFAGQLQRSLRRQQDVRLGSGSGTP